MGQHQCCKNCWFGELVWEEPALSEELALGIHIYSKELCQYQNGKKEKGVL